MRSITTAVENTVNQSPFLQELLALDIINLSGLAREIKDSVEEQTQKSVTQASIVMALKRMRTRTSDSIKFPTDIFSTMPELIIRSNLFEITLKNSPTLMLQQQKLLAYANRQKSYLTTFTYGIFETTTIASNQVKEMAEHLYKKRGNAVSN